MSPKKPKPRAPVTSAPSAGLVPASSVLRGSVVRYPDGRLVRLTRIEADCCDGRAIVAGIEGELGNPIARDAEVVLVTAYEPPPAKSTGAVVDPLEQA